MDKFSKAEFDLLRRLARGPCPCFGQELKHAMRLYKLGLARRVDQVDRRNAPFEITPAGRGHIGRTRTRMAALVR